MSNEILTEIQEKLKSLEYELKIWDDEYEGGGQLAKRELTGKVEAYREILGMMGSLRSDAGELGGGGLVCPKNFAAWCQENYSIEIPERVVMEYERYYNAMGQGEQLKAFLLFIQENAPNYRTKQLKPDQVIKAYLESQ